jgi:hypothetical protein
MLKKQAKQLFYNKKVKIYSITISYIQTGLILFKNLLKYSCYTIPSRDEESMPAQIAENVSGTEN